MSAPQSNPEATAEAPKSGGGLLGKLTIAGFMLGVVAVECLLAYFLFPSPEEVAALAEKNLQKSLPAALSSPDSHGAEANAEEAIEVDLGEYSITVTQADGASSLRVDFHLYGTVAEGEQEAMKVLYERNLNRFRDQILYEIRNSASTDLADPGLALIKRRILEKSNALLGKPVLKSVVFSQFSYFEQ